ncbi:MAG: hypothetical protein JNN04_09920 [Cyclobacteriaceae bacterium]|nr:hypothetical protein [Cyclobacteriaceae bacterium]
MKGLNASLITGIICAGLLGACSTIEKSSRHGFESGYYRQRQDKNDQAEKVYLDITDEKVTVYSLEGEKPGPAKVTLPIREADSLHQPSSRFSKKSLDIDLTSVLFKYRPRTGDLPEQLSAELNVALYAGWRRDYYAIKASRDPLGRNQYRVVSRGFDFGILAGTGTTLVSPSTTRGAISTEYNGMILELGLAGFVETSFASFGLAVGFDHLVGPDRSVWIYNQKPWVGFVVGVAIN